ncbi:MAG: hypothetical protein LUQ50_11960 [Methanospirillum sp.]|uniref:CARDB domain-containing protein n=1 Tax=Methanospirillum sp. TaxID=45200 RepID=UPI0023741B72|nr:CARDB domain-containing protein [Methanospirillum sp.]MDD1729770.1 hypothetical protein [Methanospirillum sp.]
MDPSYIYGTPPTDGKFLLNLINDGQSNDIVAVITKGGDQTPLFAIYIPSKSSSTVKNMGTGMFSVYFMTGIDWNEQKSEFNDAVFYKFTTPLIIGTSSDNQIEFYNSGKLNDHIKKIDKAVFPDISGSETPDVMQKSADIQETTNLVIQTSVPIDITLPPTASPEPVEDSSKSTQISEKKSTGPDPVIIQISKKDPDQVPTSNPTQNPGIEQSSQSEISDKLITSDLPDLIITKLSMKQKSNVIAGTLTIQNKGAVDSGKFTITYFLTDMITYHPVFGNAGIYILGSDSVSGLGAGEQRDSSDTKMFTIDNTVPAGIYWIGAFIDSQNVIDEFDKENNVVYDTNQVQVEKNS